MNFKILSAMATSGLFLIFLWHLKSPAPEDVEVGEIVPSKEVAQSRLGARNLSPESPGKKVGMGKTPRTNRNQSETIRKLEYLKKQVGELKAEIPKKELLRDLDHEDLHRTPAVILNAGKTISQIVQVIQNNPRYARELSQSIKDCALDSDVPNTVRAYCLYRYTQLTFVTDEEEENLKFEIGDPVVKLSNALSR